MSQRLREERAVARLAAFYEDRRRMDAARAMTPRARAGNPAAGASAETRDADAAWPSESEAE